MQVKINPNRALAELCRRSFFRFVQEFWDVIIPETPVWNWHIKYLCDELQYLNTFVMKREPKPYDLIINIPPGSTKSTIATQMYNAWVWTVDPTQRFIASSYAHSLSLSHAIKTRDIVNSDKYKDLFPEIVLKEDQRGKSDFRNDRGGQRFTTSTGGTVTGMHAHQIIVDDPINPQQSASDAERESANTFVTSTLSSRKIDKAVTPTIIIMQRLHEADPTGVMLSKKNKKIKHINLPAEDKGNVLPAELAANYIDGLLDPIRLNREVLDEALIDLGSYGYAGQYGQNPAPQEGGLIKKHWFEIIDWKPEFNNLAWNFTADTAYTEDESNDPSGYLAYAKYNNDFIIRFAQTEYLEFPDLCKALPTFAQQNGYSQRSVIEVEPKASGKSLVQTLKRETSLNIKEGKPPANDKVARVNDTSPTMEAGRVKLVRGVWNKEFLDQISTFPNAEHDEYVDCLTMMIGDTRPKKKGIKRRN
jgi:predicted phage terminase large subunit-like protein